MSGVWRYPRRYGKYLLEDSEDISRRNKYIYLELLKDRIVFLQNYQGPESGLGSVLLRLSVKSKTWWNMERGKAKKARFWSMLKCQTKQALPEACFHLIPQVLLPGQWMFRTEQWVVPLILPKPSENRVLSLQKPRGTLHCPSHSWTITLFSLNWFPLLAEHPWCLVLQAPSHGLSHRDPVAAGGSGGTWLSKNSLRGTLTFCGWRGEIKIIKIKQPLCVLSQLTGAMPGSSNNASGANKILSNPSLDYSETFIFIRSYQHASKAHIN